MLVRTQSRENGSIDYNPVIRLVEVAGAIDNLWKILELLQVIEIEIINHRREEADA